MKVLYVSKALAVGAYRGKLRALAEYCDITAIVPAEWNGGPVDPVVDGEPVELAAAVLHGHNHIHVYRHASSLVARARPDLVHIDEEPYSAVSAQMAWHCRRRDVPCCFFAWQNLAKRIPPPFGALRGYVFRTARGGIAGTEAAAAVLRGWGWHGPLAVIPQFGVDTTHFRPDATARARVRERIGAGGAFVLGYAGRLVPEKGVHLLFPSIREQTALRLLIVGDGPQRASLESAARSAGIADRIHFAGRIDSRRIPDWLNAMDALALPSLRTHGWMEQFGRILVEAMACGVPVIGSRTGEIPAVIGDAGLLVPEGDAAALAAAVAVLAGSAQHRALYAERGRSRVEARFTNEHIASETYGFYRRLLGAA